MKSKVVAPTLLSREDLRAAASFVGRDLPPLTDRRRWVMAHLFVLVATMTFTHFGLQ
jgi:hypothetical protein